jgi:hypothetical protein
MSVVIHGTVADLAGRPAEGQRVAVLAWAPNAAISVMLVQGFADHEGRFRLEYGELVEDAYVTACAVGADGRILGWTENLAGAPEDALVRIALGATNPIPLSAGRPDDTVLDLPSSASLAPPPASDGEEYAVSGRIGWPDGTAAIGVIVRAVDKDLRGEQPLGPYTPDFDQETRTDGAGRYRIPYLSRQFSEREIASADLVVQVLARDGRVAAASPVLFNAPRDATVDLVLPARAPRLPAEFERVVAALDRLLDHAQEDDADRDPTATAGAITAADVPFLAGETGIPADRFQAVIAASALVARPDDARPDPVDARQWVPAASGAAVVPTPPRYSGTVTIPVEVLYGLIRVGDPADWTGLAALSTDRLTEDIDRAVDEGIIADRLRATAQRHADAIAAEAALALSAWVEQGAELADPRLRYARTGTVANPVVDTRLDQALRDAVRQAIGTDSAALDIATAPALTGLSWRAVRPQSTIAASAVRVLNSAAKLDPAVAEAAQAATARIDQQPATMVAAALSLDVPLRDNPWLAEDLCTATVSALAGIAGLSGATRTAVIAAAADLATAPGETLAELTSAATLTADQATAVAAMLELSDLTDGNIPLIEMLSAQGTTSPSVLAGWSAEQWRLRLGGDGTKGSAAIPLPPGLGVDQYADLMVANLELARPTQALAARLAAGNEAVRAFFADNPDVDLRAVDLARGDVSSLNWQGVPTGERPQVKRELRSYQRLLALADTTADRVALSRHGFDSAFAIVALAESEFAAQSGLDAAIARLTYARAQDLAASAAHAYGAVHDAIRPPWPTMPVANTSPDFIRDLMEVQGVADLFRPERSGARAGSGSVLGTAAYFVDLMHFAEQQVSRPVFVSPKLTDHARYLKNRRPDLWALPLTDDNADTRIPALRIVNEILQAHLAKLLGDDPFQALADPTDKATCAVPFNLPHAELGIYLGHFGLTPAGVYRTLRLSDATIDRALTGLSADEAAIVATADQTGIVQRLGATDAADLADLPVQQYLRRMGLTRSQLTVLLASRFNPDLAEVRVVRQRSASPIQDSPEILQGLTAARADAAFRFVRLARPLPWTLGELDLVLFAARQAGLVGTDIDAATVQVVGRLVRVQSQLDLSAQQLCAVIDGTAPTIDPRTALLVNGLDTDKSDLAQVEQLIEVTEWITASAFTLDQLQFILAGTSSVSAPYSNDLQTVSAFIRSDEAAEPPTDRLATALNVSPGRLADLLAWTGRELTDDVPDEPEPLLDLVRSLERVALLFAGLRFSDETVGYLTESFAKLGIADRAALTYADVQALCGYADLCSRAVAPGAEAVTRALLDAYAAADSFGPDQHANLALLTGAEASLVATVLAAFALPAVPWAALSRADELIACCKLLGVDAYALLKLGEEDSLADLTAAAQVAADSVRAQFADEAERDRALSEYQDKINALKRDALCDYLVNGRPELRFSSRKDLSDYFLIDVDMDSSARISRVDAAISSVQLYIQRCLTGLEPADPALVPREQWAWRRSFRVWRANREIFFYPESHLDPDLRDDKTPAFADAENAAPQQLVADYRAEVEKLADLEIIEACYDAASRTYHALGRTRQDPATTYRRSWDGTTWLPWAPVPSSAALPGFPATVIQLGDEQFLVRDNRALLRVDGLPARQIQDARVERQFSSATHVLGGQVEIAQLLAADDVSRSAPPAPTAAEASAELTAFAKSSTPILFTPLAIAERRSLIRLSASVTDHPNCITPDDAFAVYQQELFLHLPWLIADRLNAAGRYEDAAHWLRQIFDPTAAESPSEATPADRVWRYAGFRGIAAHTLEKQVTDTAALAAYRKAPFSPFAVARLRPAAFQKAIVLRFVSNLISWGDELFAQNTAESANEAALLYALASDILGPRPTDSGEHDAASAESEPTYEAIGPDLGNASDRLATLENWVYQARWSALGYHATAPDQAQPSSPSVLPFDTITALVDARAHLSPVWGAAPIKAAYPPHLVAQSTLAQSTPAFGVPPNATLLACWDTLEDRLAKLSRRRDSGAASR